MFSVNTQQKGLEKKKDGMHFVILVLKTNIEKEFQKNNNL